MLPPSFSVTAISDSRSGRLGAAAFEGSGGSRDAAGVVGVMLVSRSVVAPRRGLASVLAVIDGVEPTCSRPGRPVTAQPAVGRHDRRRDGRRVAGPSPS